MRCYCCNRALSDYESTRKVRGTEEYADMCNSCIGTISDQVGFTERTDIDPNMEEDMEYEEGVGFAIYEEDNE
jgi:hypothetical protein